MDKPDLTILPPELKALIEETEIMAAEQGLGEDPSTDDEWVVAPRYCLLCKKTFVLSRDSMRRHKQGKHNG